MTRRMTRNALVAGLVVVFAASMAFAHHGWSSYDEKTPLTIQGTITESAYTNPHGAIKLRATAGDKTWDVVLAPVARMQTRGLTEAMLKPGTTATVIGYQHREIATELRAENITIDQKKVELR